MSSKRNREVEEKGEMSSLPIVVTKKPQLSSRVLDATKLELIPQLGGTCWFNVILTVLLYSQWTRKVLYEETLNWFSNPEELKTNRFKRFLMFMLNHCYSNPKKIEELFQKRIKPELLLLSFINYYKLEDIKGIIKANISKDLLAFGYDKKSIDIFLSIIFNDQLKIMKLFVINNNSYIHHKYMGLIDDDHYPGIIILQHDKFKGLELLKQNISSYTIIDDHISGATNYEDEIIFKGRRYKLDAILMNNYSGSHLGSTHAICGITYDNKGYVYNGWINARAPLNFTSHVQYRKKSNCRLFPKDWKSDLRKAPYSAGFCLPQNVADCRNILPLDSRELCFDFSVNDNTDKILIYALVEDEPLSLSLSSRQARPRPQPSRLMHPRELQSLLSIKNLVYKSRSVLLLIDEYYDFNGKTTAELEGLLKKIYGSVYGLSILTEDLSLFKVFYLILTGERLTEEAITGNKDGVLRRFFIGLLEVFVKDDKLFRLPLLFDDVIYLYIPEKQLWELLLKIGYSIETTEEIIMNYNNYLVLFYIISKELSKIVMTEIERPILILNLIKFFIQNGIIIDIPRYTDEIILRELEELSIEALKSLIKTERTGTAELLAIIDEIIEGNEINEDKKRVIEGFINSNIFFKEIYVRFKEKGLKVLLILIIISQKTSADLLKITGGKGNRKIKKKLRFYQ